MKKSKGWNPEQLRATAEEIRGAVMPKSITPEMVGGTLTGIIDTMESLSAHRREAGIYPFDGVCADVDMLDAMYEGQVLWDKSRSCFMECADLDENAWTNAGEDYCMQGHYSSAIPRTDRLYRAGGALYRVGGSEDSGFELVRLVDEGDARAVRTELRREIVGLWDETAKIQAKLADLYSTETDNLLRRLGYEQEDIDEYRWAVSHLDIEISLEDLRESVKAWENHSYPIYVAPKWTAEMEAGELTPLEMRKRWFNSARYFPHITTGRGFWADSFCPFADYYAGLHATAPCAVAISYTHHLGRFTGKITRFHFNWNGCTLETFKLLKSDVPIVLTEALTFQYYIDLSNIDVENATNLSGFTPISPPRCSYFGTIRSLPKGFFDTDKSVKMHNALGGSRFVGESFDLQGRIRATEEIFCGADGPDVYQDKRSSTIFDDCDINLSLGEDEAEFNELAFSYFGYFLVPANKKSRIKAHGLTRIYPCALISPYMNEGTERAYCGVWEVDCPDVEDIRPDHCWPETSATFWNLGSNLRTRTLLLREMMKSYQFGYQQDDFYGFMAANEILRESFRASLRTWVSPPEACSIVLYKEQYDALTEDDIATLTEKGYSIVVDNSYGLTSGAQYKFN